jgi:hypothetical protein
MGCSDAGFTALNRSTKERSTAPKARRTGNTRANQQDTLEETVFSPALRAVATPVPGALFFLHSLPCLAGEGIEDRAKTISMLC